MLRKFAYRTIFIVVISTLAIVTSIKLLNVDNPLITYLLPVYFGLLNVLFIFYLQKSLKQATSRFISKYLAGTAIRFILSLIFVVIFVISDRQHAIIFVIVFASNYLLFLVHEIVELLNFLNKKTD